MPELPEVEVIMRGIKPLLLGKTIGKIGESGKRLRLPIPMAELKEYFCGAKITRIYRRAKYLCLEINKSSTVIIHLGMTGNVGIFPSNSQKAKHDHFWSSIGGDQELRYNDTRRFGSIRFYPEVGAALNKSAFVNLGPEPLTDTFTIPHLTECANNKKMPIKTFLMTNAVVVGIGNIYANESLFMAKISPFRPASSLNNKELVTLHKCIREVLTHAIECGGSTISDFVNANQQSGYFQMNFKVYGKDGEKCSTCEDKLLAAKIGGRASFYCPSCQK
ncbi:MAG: bifunctional DNA-formamidopyrimidine glycosylase/DNA-(apurinic or apyrimidinic site) lyase [Desulfotalea sp.]